MDTKEAIIEHGKTLVNHEDRIANVENKVSTLHSDFTELKNILQSIKYWLYGIGTLYVAEQYGLAKVISKIIGL